MLSGLGLSEILIILLVALVVVGPEKIPDVAKMLGKGVREVRRASNMFRDMFMIEDSAQHKQEDRRDELHDGPTAPDEDHQIGVAGTVARSDHAMPPARPVLLAPMRRPTGMTEAALTAPVEPKDCTFVHMPATTQDEWA